LAPPHIFRKLKTAAAAAKVTMIIRCFLIYSVASVSKYIIHTCTPFQLVGRRYHDRYRQSVTDVDVTGRKLWKKSSAPGVPGDLLKITDRVLEDVVGSEETLLRLRAIAVDGNV
jgi:hypothetical protein